jgi:hypothetical protein
MKELKYVNMRTAIPLLLVLLLVGCATQLAPNYDKAIVDKLTSTNVKLMEHYASVSSGTDKSMYSQRADTYNSLIGNLDALVIQAKARPMPDNQVIKKVNKYLGERAQQLLGDDVAPSATAMEKISETIVKMRDTDEKQNLTAAEVKLFKGQTVIYMDQALTYESFLKR